MLNSRVFAGCLLQRLSPANAATAASSHTNIRRWTAVSTSSLQLFSCIRVDLRSPGSPYNAYFLVHDMTERCVR